MYSENQCVLLLRAFQKICRVAKTLILKFKLSQTHNISEGNCFLFQILFTGLIKGRFMLNLVIVGQQFDRYHANTDTLYNSLNELYYLALGTSKLIYYAVPCNESFVMRPTVTEHSFLKEFTKISTSYLVHQMTLVCVYSNSKKSANTVLFHG